MLHDLANDQWILPSRRVYCRIHDTIIETAQYEEIVTKEAHDVITAQQAIRLVSEHVGVAILPKPTRLDFVSEDVIVKPLSDKSLRFDTCLVMRSDEESRMLNDFARSFLRKQAQQMTTTQMELPLTA